MEMHPRLKPEGAGFDTRTSHVDMMTVIVICLVAAILATAFIWRQVYKDAKANGRKDYFLGRQKKK
jgi:hypothetical protein